MIITLKEAYGNDDILKQFPKPDYTHISPKITVSDARWIDFDKIHIDEDEGNVARSDNEKEDLSSRVNELVQSFTAGVLLNQEIGAVQHRGLDENGDEYEKPYKLLYSFGRSLAQMEIGVKGWAFNIIDGTEKEIEDVCSFENEDPPVKHSNKEKDIINLKNKQVVKGTLKNEEDVIRADLRKTYPRRKKESINRIASGIFEHNNTPLKYAYYTDAKIKLWRENHCSTWFEVKGGWDESLQKFGFTAKIGGLYRSFHRALNKYAEFGLTSYVNAYTGQVSKGSTLEQQKLSIINEYIKLRVNHAIVYGKDKKFLTLNGFFPQSIGVDNWKNFIKIDQDIMEKKVELAIKRAKKLRKVRSAA
tara:strand:- start:36 stop:1118 length:1083 start_codon:yes stop_codon:yes gene_type:complete